MQGNEGTLRRMIAGQVAADFDKRFDAWYLPILVELGLGGDAAERARNVMRRLFIDGMLYQAQTSIAANATTLLAFDQLGPVASVIADLQSQLDDARRDQEEREERRN